MKPSNRALLLVGICGLLAPASFSPAAAPAAIKFAAVKPILDARCLSCHGGRVDKGGLSVKTYAALMKGGQQGKEVIPGKPDTSPLVLYIQGKKTPKMPFRGINGNVTDPELKKLKDWIKAGAKA